MLSIQSGRPLTLVACFFPGLFSKIFQNLRFSSSAQAERKQLESLCSQLEEEEEEGRVFTGKSLTIRTESRKEDAGLVRRNLAFASQIRIIPDRQLIIGSAMARHDLVIA